MTPQIKERIEKIARGEVPEGYKKTKVGIVPNEWEDIKAKNLFDNISDKNHNGELEVLSATQDRGVVPRSSIDIDIKYDESSLSHYKRVRKGNFVISLRSFQGGIEYSNYDGLVSPAYTVLQESRPIIHNFYKAYLKSSNYISRLNTAVYGIRDGKQISYSDFGMIKIPYPSLPEQQKIADILTAQDNVIKLKEKLIEQKQAQKKYLMQQLLTGKKRLNGLNSEWEELLVKDCIDEYSEKSTINNQYPILTSARTGLMLQTEYYKNRQVTTNDNIGYNVLPYGYITFRSRSDDGHFKFNKNKIIDKGIISYFYPVFNFKENVCSDFMLMLLNESIYEKMYPLVEGTAQQVLSIKKLGLLKYKVPSLPEQQAIADILTTADKEIELLQAELEQEKQKKKALMQLLLTGIVRVKV